MIFKIGVLLDSLQMPFSEALREISAMNVDSLQFYASSRNMPSGGLSVENAKKIKRQIKDNNLELSALVGDLGGHGFELNDENVKKIPGMKRIVDFAQELETNIITTHIGVIPHSSSEKYSVMQEALVQISRYSKSAGIYLAIETGPEKSEVLKKFIEDTGESHLRVNFDPANIVMIQGEKAADAVGNLKDYIIHTHAKDGIRVNSVSPQKIYDAFAEGNPDKLDFDKFFRELPLGSGDVDFPEYLKALKETGFSGSLTIEREAGNNRLKDVREGVKFLKDVLEKLS